MMKTNKSLLISLFALFVSMGIQAQRTITSYARSGVKTILSLAWNTDNYGTIQWQQSADQGKTWTDISGANGREYEVTPSVDTYLRVVVSGDEACEPLTETHIVKVFSFSSTMTQQLSREATFSISNLTIAPEAVAEYGFCYNYSGVNRGYRSMQHVAVGTQIPGADFEATCPGLLPNKSYSIRFYIKTQDGSFVYGPGRLVTTLPGLEWSSEDWIITKNMLQPYFNISGYVGAKPTMKFEYGTDKNNMSSANILTVDADSHKYRSSLLRSLKSGTTYYLRVTADIDGEEQVIEKTVRTLTDYSNYEVDQTVMPASHRISWDDQKTAIQLNPSNIQAEYPRMLRVSKDTLLLTYHGGDGTGSVDHWHDIYIHHSYDNGKTWTAPEKILDMTKTWLSHGWYRFTNADMVKLQNGWILMTWSSNANPETNENCQVLVMISKDGGETWGDPITVLRGRVWEPQIVQLPGGELELLVSSEKQWWGTGGNLNQEIVVSRSTDNGETWTAQARASYNPDKRDGMPVQVVLQGNKGILFSYESIGSGNNPSISWRPLNGEWDSSDWDEQIDDRRWVAEPIRGGCAPYALQLETGEVVVMGHLDQNGDVWQTSRLKVCVGDNTGHNFKYTTIPFSSLPRGEGAYYGSLFQKDSDTIWLLYSHSYYSGSTCTKNCVELLEGRIVKTQ